MDENIFTHTLIQKSFSVILYRENVLCTPILRDKDRAHLAWAYYIGGFTGAS